MIALRKRLVPLATLLAVAGAWAVAGSLDLWTIDGPGPGLLPKIALMVTAIVALILLIRPDPVPESETEEVERYPRSFVVYSLACAFIAVSVPWLGFVLPGLVCVCAILRFAEDRSWFVSLGYAVALLAVIVLLFGTLLNVQFPDGPLEDVLQSNGLL
ncbi:tripartite tricarboxylate transporter TctB family protein [Tianweitania sediminis]|uniref:Tripartite tricarboxylate transporter TctB family protein n=1 Tax=Tianweitania sediminis TaxID=1502156 RepID=A0A8J7QYR5_9HYPH|nr:tripartite tricarboxylate transporter TctB family protein [Tianweitania sediminis]MBP0437717.1 tripartite tricarboxylate transporter TctB family protein [Tianweitania sediminis]